jgi:hypothetical protein
MKRFDHTWDEILNNYSIINQAELLSKRSKEGWELVTVIVGSGNSLRFYWKREIEVENT